MIVLQFAIRIVFVINRILFNTKIIETEIIIDELLLIEKCPLEESGV